MPGMLVQSDEARRREAARAGERQIAEQDWQRRKHAVLWQCVALGFVGVPLFGLSMYIDDGRRADVALAAAFFVSYACPFFRWLIFHLQSIDRDDY